MLKLDMDFKQSLTLCPKCGFRPNGFQNKWKLDYTDNCNNTCPWEDTDVSEHFHANCPECGYELVVPCNDYKEQKGNQWNTTDDAVVTTPAVMTPPVRRLPVVTTGVGGSSVTLFNRQPVVDPWEVECNGCPCSKDKTETPETPAP